MELRKKEKRGGGSEVEKWAPHKSGGKQKQVPFKPSSSVPHHF